MSSPRVAIIADWMYGGGAEKVVLELHRLYPNAPIYTSYCSPEWQKRLGGNVITGYLQRWPFAKARKFLPLLRQLWFKRLNLKKFDVIISCTGNGEAKFVRARTGAQHICYCFTPPHFYWKKYQQYISNPGMGKLNGIARLGLKILVKPLRSRDHRAAQRVDQFVAISHHIQHDILACYGRESVVIFPPVDTELFANTKHKQPAEISLLTWGRHVPYKRFDLVIAACNEVGLPLVVAGTGPETRALKSIAGPTIEFAGFVTDKQLVQLASNASAFVFAGEEDFGIAMVEAMALGLPVIAYGGGGAADFVIPGKTGQLFDSQTVACVSETLREFKPTTYSATAIHAHAKLFNAQRFRSELSAYVQKLTS